MSRTNPNFSIVCPSPYRLDPALGLCIEPTPPGFAYVNGRFVRQCPAGMSMNDSGICIRPVMTRKSFVDENSIQATTLAIGGNKVAGGSTLVFGKYDKASLDMSFSNSLSLAENGSIEQVKLSEGSTGLFLVAQDNKAGNNVNRAHAHEIFDGVSAATPLSSAPVLSTTDAAGEEPEGTVLKMEYSSEGQMYFLGSPRNTIFQASYNASDYISISTNNVAPGDVAMTFQRPAFSVAGSTEPFYVGSYSQLSIDQDGHLNISAIGALQSGLDANIEVNPVPLTFNQVTMDNLPDPNKTCLSKTYEPTRPTDPLPQILTSVSDATSRGFTADFLLESKGFVIVGRGHEIIDPSKLGQGVAVRYLDNDPCTLLKPVPRVPFMQARTEIDLNLGSNSGNTRIARFDVTNIQNSGAVDTFYVFGSDGITPESSVDTTANDTLVSFITENHVHYHFTQHSVLVVVDTVSPTVPPDASHLVALTFTSSDQILTNHWFVKDINDYIFNIGYANTKLICDDAYFTQFGFLKIDLITDQPTLYVSIYFSHGLAGLPDLSLTADFFGFPINGFNTAIVNPPDADVFILAPEKGSFAIFQNISEFNGLSWDDTTNNSLVAARPLVRAMPVGLNGQMRGGSIKAWNYDAVSQSLAFAIGLPEVSTVGSSYNILKTIYDSSSPDRLYTIPENCIDIEVQIWAAGGSSDPNSTGTGGAGSYVSGHLNRNLWSAVDKLGIVVGSTREGSGGHGNRNGIGIGGGRSAVTIGGRDVVTAGGGGGSVGKSNGGAGGLIGQDAIPSTNGGKGATSSLAGLGGKIFGDTRFTKSNDGYPFNGGSSTWTALKGSVGGGGGGSGYLGGGSGGYLGNTGDLNDVPAAGGGGSSFANSTDLAGASFISGNRSKAPFMTSPNYSDGIAAGGTVATGGLGGPGRVVIVATTSTDVDPSPFNSIFGSSSGSMGLQIWANSPFSMSTITEDVQFGSISKVTAGLNEGIQITPADWSKLFVNLTISGYDRIDPEISAIYSGLGGLVVVVVKSADGSIVGPPNSVDKTFTNVWWTILDPSDGNARTQALQNMGTLDAFGPLDFASVDGSTNFTVDPIKNVRSIRALEPINGSRDLVFIGDGIRIVRAPTSKSSSWSLPRFVRDEQTGLQIDSSVSFVDAQFNEKTGSLEAVGKPSNFNINVMHQSPWSPIYASFYNPLDISMEITPYNPWYIGNFAGIPTFYQADTTFNINYTGPAIKGQGAPNTLLRDILPNYKSFAPTAPVPNTIFCIRRCDSEVWFAINIYDALKHETYPTLTDNGTIDPTKIRIVVQEALNSYLNYICATVPTLFNNITQPTATVVVGSYNVMSITFENLALNVQFEMAFITSGTVGLQDNWQSIFGTVGNQISQDDVDTALISCGHLLGFVDSVRSVNSTSGLTYQASWTASSSLQMLPNTSLSQTLALTPLSVPLPVNSVYAGSLYHVYAPAVKFATLETGAVVSIGGPICDPVETTAFQNNDGISGNILCQPISVPGSKYFIDFVFDSVPWTDDVEIVTRQWSFEILSYSSDNVIQTSTPGIIKNNTNINLRSPANILMSEDQGASYSYSQSLLGCFLSSKNSPTATTFVASTYALTGFDCFHLSSSDNVLVSVGPAKFRDLTTNSTQVNAAVSQFNDIKWIPCVGEISGEKFGGYFIAVGQFVWELNAMLARNVVDGSQTVKWPTDFKDLRGVVWVSLDGRVWTTLPIYTLEPVSRNPELFWMVYKIDYVDPINNLATIITDLGLYMFNAQTFMSTILNLFYVTGPILDFTTTTRCLSVVPVGRNGPFAALCTDRDATGTCIKCIDGSPVSIPQVVGPGGIVQPNFDTCILRPDAGLGTYGYTSVEAAIDAFALASYAGYDYVSSDTPASTMVSSLKQTFYDEQGGTNTLIVCPKFTDTHYTPSSVIGPDEPVERLLQCELDPAMQQPIAISAPNANTWGSVVVRRPTKNTLGIEFDTSYDGGGINSLWQANYAHELRHLNLVPFDSFTNDAKDSPLIPDSCPSTLGLGGSIFDPPLDIIGAPSIYAPNAKTNASGVSINIYNKLTNLGAQPIFNNDYPDGVLLQGPFLENATLKSSVGANYDPNNNFDRAVLANEDDTLDKFGYNTLAGNPNLVYNNLNSNTIQAKNPYLYRLSSYEFPFDGQATELSETRITIGRDPQVFEPGFGPLSNYLSGNPGSGFGVSRYNSAQLPWPANPLPREGLGTWWIRSGKSGADTFSVFQGVLGYGTLSFNKTIVDASTTKALFSYDTSSKYIEKDYLESNWTNFLPFQSSKNRKRAEPINEKRLNRAKYSIQNAITLHLKSNPESIGSLNLTNNWKCLVAVNFFRPRNWTFSGLFLGTDGIAISNKIGYGVDQQILSSDQPNIRGQYEFLIPDPYYAAIPLGLNKLLLKAAVNGTVIGIKSDVFTYDSRNGSEYDLLTRVLVGSDNQLPSSLTVVEGSCPDHGVGTMNWPQLHKAWHYFTYNSRGPATLDIYVNVTGILGAVDSSTHFDWLEHCSMPEGRWLTSNLPNVLNSYSTGQADKVVNACNALINFNANPMNKFFWSDPCSQTARSLMSMKQDGLNINLTTAEAIIFIGINDSGLKMRSKGLVPSPDEYVPLRYSLLHYQYSVDSALNGGSLHSIMFNSNKNALNLFGQDTNSVLDSNGFISPADPRADPKDTTSCPAFSAKSNFMLPPSAVNVSASDYEVETDNSLLFSGITGSLNGRYAQDLLAQGTSFGDPVYGFGLRLDSDAVVPQVLSSQVSPTTNGSLPTDHGYVSMVRTIVDSHDRYTGTSTSIDSSPHVQRLTYVTKYVPSNLKNYGSMVQMPMMRFLQTRVDDTIPTGVLQLLPNPFRPRKSYLIENVPYQTIWQRSRGISPVFDYGSPSSSGNSSVQTYNGTPIYWRAINSSFFDVEAPGYWGRQKLVSIHSTETVHFDSLGNPKDTIFRIANSSPETSALLTAGYEGIINYSKILLDNLEQVQVESLRCVLPIAHGNSDLPDYLTSNVVRSVAGQMLVNLWDSFNVINTQPSGDTYPCIRLELGINTGANHPAGSHWDQPYFPQFIRKFDSLQNFMYTYVYGSGTGSFYSVMGLNMPSVALVTPEELCKIISLAIGAWFQDELNDISGYVLTVTSVFNNVTDRPEFTFTITSGGTTAALTNIKFYISNPISGWLGLVPVAPPMFDFSSLLTDRDNIFTEFAYPPINGNYRDTYISSTIGSWDSILNTYLPNADLIHWNQSWISPSEFARVFALLNWNMDPDGAECNTGRWTPGLGGPTPNNSRFDGTSILVTYKANCNFTAVKPMLGLPPNPNPSSSIWQNYLNISPAETVFDNTNLIYGPLLPGPNTTDLIYNIRSSVGTSGSNTDSLGQYKGPQTFWDSEKLGWYSMYTSNLPASQRGFTDNLGWSRAGWLGIYSQGVGESVSTWNTNLVPLITSYNPGPPLYSLYYDTTSADNITSVAFKGRMGFSETGALAQSDKLRLCDISNVSWTTRLCSRIKSATYNDTCKHWWGLASANARLASGTMASVYAADSVLIAPVLTGAIVTGQAQIIDSAFTNSVKTLYMNGAETTSIIGNPNGNIYVSGSASAAIEVPCGFGNAGSYNSLAITKPVNYDSTINFKTFAAPNITGPPAGDIVVSGNSAMNYNYATRPTFGAMTFASDPYNSTTTLVLGILPGLRLAPQAPSNVWPSAEPPSGQVGGVVNGASGVACISDANGLSVLFVKSSCFVNVGSMEPTGDSQCISLWAFNYDEIFVDNTVVMPWQSDDQNDLIHSTIDFSKYFKTYIRGTPYSIDESYDDASYSSLGRSLLIGPTTFSSVESGTPLARSGLSPSADKPVILIFAPASRSNSLTDTIKVSSILNTYSNSMMYSFTMSTKAYGVSFTDVGDGPMWVFYGLDNKKSVGSGVQASVSTEIGSVKKMRRIFVDLSLTGQSAAIDETMESELMWGLDIRQVYSRTSLTVNSQPVEDPYGAGYTGSWIMNTKTVSNEFTRVSYEQPLWANGTKVTRKFLPLAGTWVGDKSTVHAEAQSVPNYEGLSLIAEWATKPSNSNTCPQFTQYAVDRQLRTGEISKPGGPFSSEEVNSMRPNSLFVVLCDIWRNTIRTSMPVDSASKLKTLSGLVNIDFVDCMGPSDYNSTDAVLSSYFGMCNGTLPRGDSSNISRPSIPQTSDSTYLTTPWFSKEPKSNGVNVGSSNQIWSPFTGGSFWETFQPNNQNQTGSDSSITRFSPNIWWPTYRWLLGDTDPNNVWPTSVTTNSTLLKASQFIFACTDGTIRKMVMPPDGSSLNVPGYQYPVIDSTTINTFYNSGINEVAAKRVYSFVWPGRLYNLTWWNDNWWCTADNSSVWTTAPLDDSTALQTGTPINDPTVTREFVSSIITFRPLSESEGHPSAWAAAQWPSTQVHKFNVMKEITYNNKSSLFISSIDGEYIILNSEGSRYQAINRGAQPVPWVFGSSLGNTSKETSFVTDIGIIGDNIIVGSMPLPIDPEFNPVPWFSPPSIVPLFINSLSFTPPDKNGVSKFMAGDDSFSLALSDSNVISSVTNYKYNSVSLNIENELDLLSSAITGDINGSSGILPSYSGTYNSGLSATGLQRIVKNNLSLPFDNLPFYSSPITGVSATYGIQKNALSIYAAGTTMLAIQHPAQSKQYTSLVGAQPTEVSLFFSGGHSMDKITRAFFVVDSNSSDRYSAGLKSFEPSTSQYFERVTQGTIIRNSDYNISSVVSGSVIPSGLAPRWLNSIAFNIKLQSKDNEALTSTIIEPNNGPLVKYASTLGPDLQELNMFQNMDIIRTSPILANLVISDMSYGKEVECIAFTTYGPYGGEAPTIAKISRGGLLPLAVDTTFNAAFAANFIEPSIMAWSPFELKWYVAGVANHMPDWPTLPSETDISSLRPTGFPLSLWPTSAGDTSNAVWDPADKNQVDQIGLTAISSRLMILSADASSGAIDSQTLQSINFKQIFAVKDISGPTILPISRMISKVTCFEFSSNITAIGGSRTNTDLSTSAVILWRTNINPAGNDLKANWSILDLATPGTVTAMKFLGYAWHIATWDPEANLSNGFYEGQSSLFFSSINFNAVSSLDSWNVNSNQLLKISSIAAATPSSADCKDGFQPDPNNPLMCVKVCPRGFTPFGSLCVQTCPAPYSETGVPNECLSDSRNARTVSPTAYGAASTTAVPKITNSGPAPNSLNWPSIAVVGIISTTLILLLIGIITKLFYK